MADQAVAHITVTESCSVIAFSDIYYTAYETPVSEPAPGFLTNDTVECQPATAIVSVDPTDGMVTAGADGAFVYTPNPGFYFTDTFTYEIRDANQAVMATSVVTVVVDEPTVHRRRRRLLDDRRHPAHRRRSGSARQRPSLPRPQQRSGRPASLPSAWSPCRPTDRSTTSRSGVRRSGQLHLRPLGLRPRHVHQRRSGHGDGGDRCDRDTTATTTTAPA